MEAKSFGKQLEEWRLARFRDVPELATLCGLHKTAVYELEKGTTDDPKLSTIFALCKALRVSPSDLLDAPYELWKEQQQLKELRGQ